MNQRRLIAGSIAVILLLLAGYSLHLALTRIYQVDECQNVYMARVLAKGMEAEFFTYRSLFLMGPLSWIAEGTNDSVRMYAATRLLFAGLFWFNLLLVAWIASGKLFSLRGLIALAGAATLAPMWDYGFEIRHDNAILACILVIWFAIRTRPMGLFSYFLAGGVTIVSLLIAVKTIVYVVPLAAAFLLFPPPAYRQPRWKLALAWLGGGLCATALIRLGSGSWEAWSTYLWVLGHVAGFSAQGSTELGAARFWPWDTLERMLIQTPLLVALVGAGAYVLLRDLWQRKFKALNWDGLLPEAVLLAITLGALMINPSPFPYNLVNLVPFAFILAFQYGTRVWPEIQQQSTLWIVVAAIVAIAHLTPFALFNTRHVNYTNARQTELQRLAETMTDPAKDRVYDATGLVSSRWSIHHQWYLHSLSIRSMTKGSGPRVRDMLKARPASVVIPSYRTNWLPPEDHDYIKEHYVPLATDFWVLGQTLPAGGGNFEVIHPGRYRVVSLHQSHLPSLNPRGTNEITIKQEIPLPVTVDGSAVANAIVEFSLGTHRVETAPGFVPTLVWLGPELNDVPRLETASHRRLFVNWY